MKLKITLLLWIMLLHSVCLLHAQTPPVKQWDNTFGGNQSDRLKCLIKTNDGGYLLAGWSASDTTKGEKTEVNRGITDYWIVKVDSNGIKQWDKTLGGYGPDGLCGACQTVDGGYILGGDSYSNIGGDRISAGEGSSDYWLVKIDAYGTKLWDSAYGGSGINQLYCIQPTFDGGFILGGISSSGIGGDKTDTSRGGADYWLVKIDSKGKKLWDKTFGGKYDEFGEASVKQTTDGGYILGCMSPSPKSGDKTESSVGDDFWIIKTNKNGVKIWDKTFGTARNEYDPITKRSDEEFQSVEQTSDGGFIVIGSTSGGIDRDKTDSSRGLTDFWIIKTNKNGIKIWDRTFGGLGHEGLNSMLQTADGGFIFAGFSASAMSGDKTESSLGLEDFWLVKTDSKGIKEWDKRFGGNDVDGYPEILQLYDRSYVLAGISYSDKSGDKTKGQRGNDDYWLLKISCATPQTNITRSGILDICVSGSVTLSALQVQGGQYQWFKNTVAIPGATGAGYTATETGKYKYTITLPGGCSATSKTLTVSNSCASAKNMIAASPNPSNGIVSVSYHSTINEQVNIYVFNKAGLPVFNGVQYVTKGLNSFTLNLSGLINGAYTLQINGNKTQTRMNLIIQK